MRRVATVVGIIVGIMSASEGQGQRSADPGARGWGSISGGWGSMSCGECGVTEAGFSLGGAWGLAVNETFLVALAIDAVTTRYEREGTTCFFPFGCGESSSQGRDTVLTIGPIARYYPLPERGAFVRGGVSLGLTGINDPDVAFDFGPHAGLGVTLGLGWDLPLGTSSVALTPAVTGAWVGASEQDSKFVQVGLGLTFH